MSLINDRIINQLVASILTKHLAESGPAIDKYTSVVGKEINYWLDALCSTSCYILSPKPIYQIPESPESPEPSESFGPSVSRCRIDTAH